jgi:hypothetical protein
MTEKLFGLLDEKCISHNDVILHLLIFCAVHTTKDTQINLINSSNCRILFWRFLDNAIHLEGEIIGICEQTNI